MTPASHGIKHLLLLHWSLWASAINSCYRTLQPACLFNWEMNLWRSKLEKKNTATICAPVGLGLVISGPSSISSGSELFSFSSKIFIWLETSIFFSPYNITRSRVTEWIIDDDDCAGETALKGFRLQFNRIFYTCPGNIRIWLIPMKFIMLYSNWKSRLYVRIAPQRKFYPTHTRPHKSWLLGFFSKQCV